MSFKSTEFPCWKGRRTLSLKRESKVPRRPSPDALSLTAQSPSAHPTCRAWPGFLEDSKGAPGPDTGAGTSCVPGRERSPRHSTPRSPPPFARPVHLPVLICGLRGTRHLRPPRAVASGPSAEHRPAAAVKGRLGERQGEKPVSVVCLWSIPSTD